jgi:hypothetical protein
VAAVARVGLLRQRVGGWKYIWGEYIKMWVGNFAKRENLEDTRGWVVVEIFNGCVLDCNG